MGNNLENFDQNKISCRNFVSFTDFYTASVHRNYVLHIYSNINDELAFEKKFCFRVFGIKAQDNIICLHGITDLAILKINGNYKKLNKENQVDIYFGKVPQRITDIIFITEDVFFCTLFKLYKVTRPYFDLNLKITEIKTFTQIGGTFCCKLFKQNQKICILRGTSNGKLFLNDFELDISNFNDCNSIIYDVYLQASQLNGIYMTKTKVIVATESRQLLLFEITSKNELIRLGTVSNLKHRFLKCGFFDPETFYGITDFNTIYLFENNDVRQLFTPSSLITSIIYNPASKETIICTIYKEFVYKKHYDSQEIGIFVSKTAKYEKRNELISLINLTGLNINHTDKIKCVVKTGNTIFYTKNKNIYKRDLFLNVSFQEEQLIKQMDESIKFLNYLCSNYILVTTIYDTVYRLDSVNYEMSFITKNAGEVVSCNCGILCTKKNVLFLFFCHENENSFSKLEIKSFLISNTTQKIVQTEILNGDSYILFEKKMIIFEGSDFKRKRCINFTKTLKGFFIIKKDNFNQLKYLFVYGMETDCIFIQQVCTKAIFKYEYAGFFSDSSFENSVLSVFDFVNKNKIQITGIEKIFQKYFALGYFEYLLYKESVVYERVNEEMVSRKQPFFFTSNMTEETEHMEIVQTKDNVLTLLVGNTIIFREQFNSKIYDFKTTRDRIVVALKSKEMLVYKIENGLPFFTEKIYLPELVKSICLLPSSKSDLNCKLILGFVTGNVYEFISQEELKNFKSSEIFKLSKLFKFKNFCVITTNDGFLKIFKTDIYIKVHKNSIFDLCVFNNIIYTVGDDHCVSCVDLSDFVNCANSTGFIVKNVVAHSAPITSVCVITNEEGISNIETMSIDGYKKMWSVDLEFLYSRPI
ncbi:hypothetical protein CDIK_0090 [Cucumispora dikerogammari]|nr:hypothetical protein CDIK_0090 [Cucumispora dikerogammari]